MKPIVRAVAAAFLVALALTFVPLASAHDARAAGTIPRHGVFVVGQTLAGVGLGMTGVQVKQHWGSLYTLCTGSSYCTSKQPVWLFEYAIGEPLGVGAKFGANGKTVAVFTLGAVGVNSLASGGGGGWKTSDGLHITDPFSSIYTSYPAATIDTRCSGYEALSMRRGSVTSSFYISFGVIYGFALTAPGESVCA
jgi:hypothetical protein